MCRWWKSFTSEFFTHLIWNNLPQSSSLMCFSLCLIPIQGADTHDTQFAWFQFQRKTQNRLCKLPSRPLAHCYSCSFSANIHAALKLDCFIQQERNQLRIQGNTTAEAIRQVSLWRHTKTENQVRNISTLSDKHLPILLSMLTCYFSHKKCVSSD